MKRWITILLIMFTTNLFSFNYPSYVKNYLDSVNNTKIENGICIELIYDMFTPIKDSMLIDINKEAWGYPISNISEVQTGDIIIYKNHIVIVYANMGMGDTILIADQNRNGDSSGVSIYPINKNKSLSKNFQVFRPIDINSVKYYKEYGKEFCLNLYTININDNEKMERYGYTSNPKYKSYLKPYIIDTDLRYTKAEFYFALYYDGVISNGELETPEGTIKVEKIGCCDFKPTLIENKNDVK